MNNTIYLLSSDGYKESLNLSSYATNEEELKTLLISQLKEIGYYIIKITQIDYTKGIIFFTYVDEYNLIDNYQLSDIEKHEYHFYTINKTK